MSAESELYAALSGHAALTALVSTRIYPDAIPEDKPLPAVVYSTEAATPEWCLNDTAAATAYRFRIVAWSTTRTSAKAVGDAHERAATNKAKQEGAAAAPTTSPAKPAY